MAVHSLVPAASPEAMRARMTMPRALRLLAASAVLSAGVLAQCPQGTTAALVRWTSVAGYGAVDPLDDESITSPAIALSTPFFMPGAVGTLDQMWVNANGEIYFTDSTHGLSQPTNGAGFGISSLSEMRGAAAGASARIAVLGGDHAGSIAAGASWNVAVDQSVAGQVTVTWADLRRRGNTTGDRFSFQAIVNLAAGSVTMNYGTTFPAPASFVGRYVGISIGNNVGTTATPSSDLSATPTSGALGLLYQAFGTSATAWDLTGQTLTISPNGTGGYVVSALVAYLPPLSCAFISTYGTDCDTLGEPTLHETFPTAAAAKAALDGNSMTCIRTADGYLGVWNGAAGPAFVAPSGGATTLAFINNDDGNVAITPSAPIPVPGGVAATWNVSVNGILTAAAAANNPLDFLPTAAEMTNAASAPAIGFYSWHDFTLTDTSPAVNGTITVEEAGGVLYVSWNAVEAYDGGWLGTVNPSTWQFQVNMTSGDVTVVWSSFDTAATSADATLVGAKLAGAGTTAGAVTLATGLPVTLTQSIGPLTLTPTGRPVITLGGLGPSENITLTADGIPDANPPNGIGMGFLFFGFTQWNPGIDLAPLLGTFVDPGCSLYTNLDIILPFLGGIGRQIVFNGGIPQPLAPGLRIFFQFVVIRTVVIVRATSVLTSTTRWSVGWKLHFDNQ